MKIIFLTELDVQQLFNTMEMTNYRRLIVQWTTRKIIVVENNTPRC